jgi:hypothetical protein
MFRAAPRQRLWRPAALVAVAAGAGLLTLFRTGGHGALDTLWAEDARELIPDALNQPFLTALVKPINGYYLALPRLLAEPVTLVPAEWAAAIVAVETGLITAVLAVAVFAASGDHIQSTVVRLLVAGPLVVAPVGEGGLAPTVAGSVIGNLATLQFPLTYAVFWLLLWSPQTRVRRVFGVATIALTGLSTVLTALYVPLALALVVRRRSGYRIACTVALTAGAVVQLSPLFLGITVRHVGHSRPDAVWALTEYADWLAPNALLGEAWWSHASAFGRVALTLVAWALLLVALVLGLARVTRAHWRVSALALWYSVGFTALQLMSFGRQTDRYLYLPGLLLIAATACVLVPRSHRVRGAVPAVAFAVVLALVGSANFVVDNQRAYALSWRGVIGDARERCEVTHARFVRVKTHPSSTWTARFRCAALR